MRVTLTSRIFSPEPAAASYRLAALADALDEAGHTVTVLTSTVPGDADSDTRATVRVKRFPVLRDAAGYVRGYVQYMSFDIPLFFRVLFGRRSDVIVTEPPPTTGFIVRIVAAIRRTPYVYYAADIWSDASESTGAPTFVVRIVRRLESFALRGARSVIAVTDGVAVRVRELGGHDRVSVIRNGIDTTIFTPDGPRIDTPPLVVYAGTTSEWQGADIFVRAFAKVLDVVPDARLVFLGQGSARDDLVRLTAELKLSAVEFHGVVPPAEAALWLRSAHAGLVSMKPGQGYDFAYPTKIHAAIACGVPVVYAGVGPGREAIERDRLGYAVDYDDDAVSQALVAVLSAAPTNAERARIRAVAVDTVDISAVARRAASVVGEAARR
jgi:glycosyltransferase involved in cell wall biosynthesis